jgi:hypothetical protein
MLNYISNLKKLSEKFSQYSSFAKRVNYCERLPNGNIRTKFDLGGRDQIIAFFPLEVLPADAQKKYSRE